MIWRKIDILKILRAQFSVGKICILALKFEFWPKNFNKEVFSLNRLRLKNNILVHIYNILVLVSNCQ